MPALIVLIWSYVWPSAWTVWASLQRLNSLTGSSGGMTTRNYAAVSSALGSAFGFTLRLGLLPLLMVIVVAPLLALAAHRAGTRSRWATRAVLAIPLACYTPAGLAVAWSVDRHPELSSPATAGTGVAVAVWLTTLGLAVAIGVTLFLAALRRRDPGRSPWPAFAVVGVLALLTVLAVSVQQFVFPEAMTAGGPANSTQTPELLILGTGFERFDIGSAAAISTVLLLILAVFGVVATVVLAASGARLEFDEAYRSAEDQRHLTSGRLVAIAATAAGLLIVLILTVVGLWPWLHGLFTAHATLPDGTSTASVLANTWLPPFVSTLVAVAVALLGGFGIGWLRPLGRGSLLVLLPFAPWLFVGNGVLAVRAYFAGAQSHTPNSFLGLIPPFPVVPALFVFTLLFFGLGEATGARWWPRVLTATAPMVLLVFGATWVVQTQDTFWQLTAATDPRHETAVVVLLTQRGQYVAQPGQIPFDLLTPVPLVVVMLLAALALQLGYLDRLAFRVGKHDLEPAPPTGGPPPPWPIR